jgi:hypothetical protein
MMMRETNGRFILGTLGSLLTFSKSENDSRGILISAEGTECVDGDSTNANDQLATQLLTSKLNIENGVAT